MKRLLLLFFLFPFVLHAQLTKQDSTWLPLKPFIGKWSGEGGGEPGNGKYERSYQFILNKNFIEIKNRSVYPATARYPKGEVHEDIGYFSYDKGRKIYKLRQFHVEGFVNEFVQDSIAADKKTLVFVTEQIENIPKGWRAKETYKITGDNEIEETFELAAPGKEFELYTKVRLRRVKD